MIKGILSLAVLLVACLLPPHAAAAPVVVNSGSVAAEETAAVDVMDSPDVDDIEPYGFKSIAIKKALRKLSRILRSNELDGVLGWIEKMGNVRSMRVVRKYAHKIADKLDELTKWSDITLDIVRQQVKGGLVEIGVAESGAAEAAYWIEKFIEWTLL